MRTRTVLTLLALSTGLAFASTASPAHARPWGALIVTETNDTPVVTGIDPNEIIVRNLDDMPHTLVGPVSFIVPVGESVMRVPPAGTYLDLENGARVTFVVWPIT